MDMRLPPLEIKILLESDPPKSITVVQRLTAVGAAGRRPVVRPISVLRFRISEGLTQAES